MDGKGGPLSPARKKKHLLTVIPDDDKPINYRFTVCLVGKPAREFATRAAESEMAQAYHPAGDRKKPETIAEGDEGVDHHHTAHTGNQDEDDKLVLFCPTGAAANELARLRFKLIAGFSDSLPLTTDKAAAANIMVALLVYKVSDNPGEDQANIQDTINDWRSRMAEVMHKPAHIRPWVTILAFGVGAAEEQAVKQYVDSQQVVKIFPSFYPDDSEETIVEALQTAAEQFIMHQSSSASARRLGSQGSMGPGAGAEKTPGKCGCAIS